MFSGCVGMAGMPYPLSLSLTDGCVGMAGCHTLLNMFWLRGYGRMPYPPMLVAWCEAQGVCV